MNLLQNFELAVSSLTKNFCTRLFLTFVHVWIHTQWILLRRPSVYHACHIIVSDIAVKTRCFGLHFCRRQFRFIFNHFYAVRPEATEFGEITQNNGHYAVQGHSRSPILVLVSVESSYDFLLVINTDLPSILFRFRDIDFDRSKIANWLPSCV